MHIDDEPDLREIVAMTLEMLGGYSVRSCGSGSEGIAAARAAQPDLILVDVMMPGLDGPATLAALQADPRTRDIPVAFMTAKVMPSEIARLHGLGACAVIPKPFDPSELCGRLQEIWRAVLRERTTAAPPLAPDAAPSSHAPDPFDNLARRFFARAAAMNDELAALSVRSDRDALERIRAIAHTLAGSGGTFGHPALSQAAAALEEAAEEILSAGAGEVSLAPALAGLRACLTSVCEPARVQAAP